MKYVTIDPSSEDASDLLAVSTEDGRVIFYSTKKLREPENDPDSSIPFAEPIAQLGGKANGLPGRIKDFEVFSLKNEPTIKKDAFLVVTANSDGAIRVWLVNGKELKEQNDSENASTAPQVGQLLNTYETGNRITCMKAFVMLPVEDQSTLEDFDEEDEDEDEESEESSDEESDAE